MPKYNVLRPIEHDQVLYLPKMVAGDASTSLSALSLSKGTPAIIAGGDTGATVVKSVSHGRDIPVNPSGVIELTEQEAAPFDMGQVERVAESRSQGVKESRSQGVEESRGQEVRAVEGEQSRVKESRLLDSSTLDYWTGGYTWRLRLPQFRCMRFAARMES